MLDTASKSRISVAALGVAMVLSAGNAVADAVTDWNLYTALATKGAKSVSEGDASKAVNSNVATRIAAIEARAVFDAVNAFNRISPKGYYYSVADLPAGATANSASAAAAQAAHDVLFALLPSANTDTRAWLDTQLAADLTALAVTDSDPGIGIGKLSAAAAVAARAADFSGPRTTYTPSTNLAVNAAVTPPTVGINATGNPGAGVWRPSNGASGDVDPLTGAPTGFSSGAIVPTAGIDFNWKNVTPFGLTVRQKQELVAGVPLSLALSEDPESEYQKELAYVESHGQDSTHPGLRSEDQLLQALFYKSDAELFTNEAARLASASYGLSLGENARLFALLDSALADARIAAWQSKYDLVFWRPVTAINADASGNVAEYAWKPLATTPSHPSSTSGHSATVAAGAEILRAFFKSDRILANGDAANLTSPAWLIGTNNGTGQIPGRSDGRDGTSRAVKTFSQLQLENGQSRIYLGVHYGIDNYQGQYLGLAVADKILRSRLDPAVKGIDRREDDRKRSINLRNLRFVLVRDSGNSGYFGGR
jgi:hypothetical protein